MGHAHRRGITLLGATAANAAETTGDDGLLSGTQAETAITAPISVVGNAISVLGDAVTPAPAPAPAPPRLHLHLHLHRLPPRLPRPAGSRARDPAPRPWSP
ncbi:chaplin family protein [Microbacterium sp. Se63.02b]|uniref:chaplin family protein n=1 Tax=Microbacterium sp. Se63.02b TaxID=2709304 RepID=UPI00160523A0|nr:chaplin family protein [Microbacterium sp. Se63.02b]